MSPAPVNVTPVINTDRLPFLSMIFPAEIAEKGRHDSPRKQQQPGPIRIQSVHFAKQHRRNEHHAEIHRGVKRPHRQSVTIRAALQQVQRNKRSRSLLLSQEKYRKKAQTCDQQP